jgi:hypothetical protein
MTRLAALDIDTIVFGHYAALDGGAGEALGRLLSGTR